MPFVDLEKVQIHYELSGLPGLPVLVFSNSLGANLSMWQPQLAVLGSQFRVLRYDTRGHGQSSTPPGPYNAETLGKDVLNLLDHLEIERVSFCGLSMGGTTGQWLALHAPQRLDKLILANTAAKIGTAEIWNARIQTVKEQGLDPVVPGTLERWFTPGFHAAAPETVTSTAAMIKGTDTAGYIACCAVIRDADFRDELSQITTPTLIITGTYDPVTTPADGHFLADNISGARYAELPVAHLSNVEAAADFNNALTSFLRV